MLATRFVRLGAVAGIAAAVLGAAVLAAAVRAAAPEGAAAAAADGAATSASASPTEDSFWAENESAMAKMMAAMAVQPSGDADADFVAMMVPHHQGAIDMAVAVLRYGHNEPLKRLAQEIIVTQQEEIAAMRLAVGDALPESAPAPTQPPGLDPK